MFQLSLRNQNKLFHCIFIVCHPPLCINSFYQGMCHDHEVWTSGLLKEGLLRPTPLRPSPSPVSSSTSSETQLQCKHKGEPKFLSASIILHLMFRRCYIKWFVNCPLMCQPKKDPDRIQSTVTSVLGSDCEWIQGKKTEQKLFLGNFPTKAAFIRKILIGSVQRSKNEGLGSS